MQALGADGAMSTVDRFLLGLAVLAAIMAGAAATEGRWLAVAVFALNAVSFLVVLIQRRRRGDG